MLRLWNWLSLFGPKGENGFGIWRGPGVTAMVRIHCRHGADVSVVVVTAPVETITYRCSVELQHNRDISECLQRKVHTSVFNTRPLRNIYRSNGRSRENGIIPTCARVNRGIGASTKNTEFLGFPKFREEAF